MLESAFNFYSLPPLISSILFFALGVYVVFNNPKLVSNIFFALICLATFWWQFSWFFLFNATSPEWAGFLVKMGYVGIIFIPVFFFHFFIIFLESINKIDRFLLVTSYIATFFLGIALFFTNYFIDGFYKFYWGFYPKAGILHPIYLILLAVLAFRAVYLFLYGFKKNTISTNRYFQKNIY